MEKALAQRRSASFPFRIVREGRWLICRLDRPHQVVSWAPCSGGQVEADTVAWYQVGADELAPPVDPKHFLREKLLAASLAGAVGLLTSAGLDSFVDIEKKSRGIAARSLATVGLSNALRVGDPPLPSGRFGTINLMCAVNRPLTREAAIEGLSIVVEARTTAMLEARVPSARTGEPATGTGTDCVVFASPSVEERIEGRIHRPLAYAGKHTALGHLIGASALEAVRAGIRRSMQWSV